VLADHAAGDIGQVLGEADQLGRAGLSAHRSSHSNSAASSFEARLRRARQDEDHTTSSP
jgi:hypothetical protein